MCLSFAIVCFISRGEMFHIHSILDFREKKIELFLTESHYCEIINKTSDISCTYFSSVDIA